MPLKLSLSGCWWSFSTTQIVICSAWNIVLFQVCLTAVIALFQSYFRGFTQFKHILIRSGNKIQINISIFLGLNMMKQDHFSDRIFWYFFFRRCVFVFKYLFMYTFREDSYVDPMLRTIAVLYYYLLITFTYYYLLWQI